MKEAHKKGDEQPDPELPPLMYRLHTSRRIHQGERIVLPYHSIAQKFLITGTVSSMDHDESGNKDNNDTKTTSVNNSNSSSSNNRNLMNLLIRFWTQTLHDQPGTDSDYVSEKMNPLDFFLTWDYYPAASVSFDDKKSNNNHTTTINPHTILSCGVFN